jgi:hypothetical protein
MCGAIVTSPFDVVKTRLQSDLFRQKHAAMNIIGSGGSMVMSAPRPTNLLYNFVETGYIIRYVSHLSKAYRPTKLIRTVFIVISTAKNPSVRCSKVSDLHS